tara:strand:+ start:399 stop:791 length:393 start_codon:yes stop_codon:yes gene_type:complete
MRHGVKPCARDPATSGPKHFLTAVILGLHKVALGNILDPFCAFVGADHRAGCETNHTAGAVFNLIARIQIHIMAHHPEIHVTRRNLPDEHQQARCRLGPFDDGHCPGVAPIGNRKAGFSHLRWHIDLSQA